MPRPVWAGQYSLNGNGKMTGTHWVNDAGYFVGPICITNTHSVGMVHHGAVRWMIETYGDYYRNEHAWAMPQSSASLIERVELNADHIDPFYLGVVEAAEEAVINAVVAGEDVVTVKPRGLVCGALPIVRLRAIFAGQ